MRDRELATCLSADSALSGWPGESVQSQVHLYVDRSGSMRGFLDPAYEVRPGYRRAIDQLLVTLQPEQAFGFGSSLSAIDPSLGRLLNRDFYSDNNTEMEDALQRIATDSLARVTHLIIGDGRRSDPNAANEQYRQMRELARRWIRQGGTYLLAATRAPFTPEPNDPAGCRAADGSAPNECPLYAFVFIARGDANRIVTRFVDSAAFEHLFVWPLAAAWPTRVVPDVEHGDVAVEPWETTHNGESIIRVRGSRFTNTPLPAHLALDPGGKTDFRAAAAAIGGQRLRAAISVKPLRETAAGTPWTPSGDAGALVRSVPEQPHRLELLSRGDGERFLYKVELYPTGDAAWLQEYDASSAADEVRTFGLGRLFELFRGIAQTEGHSAVQRAYVVVN